MEIKYVIIIQCEIAQKRCSGFACTEAFYNKNTPFQNYNEKVRYISFTCGGCCGKTIASKLEHFSKKLLKKTSIKKEETAVHLSSCMVTDNYHYTPCPHLDYIKNIIIKKGFKNIIEGSYLSSNAAEKRKAGIYQNTFSDTE